MNKIEFVRLTTENFNGNSLNGFKRFQSVKRCWRKENGAYALKPVIYTEDWNVTELKELAQSILKFLSSGDLAFGAISKGEIVGFALLKTQPFGSCRQYLDLAEFYVSEPFRRRGIGKTLFNEVCSAAKKLGATKLYISAHSAEESIAAYESYGCVYAKEINEELAAKEPCDLQLEYDLLKI